MIIISFLALFLGAGIAQETGTIRQPDYVSFWGTAADTLVASDSLTLTLRIRGTNRSQIDMALAITKVSGTVTNNFFIKGSMDGITYFDIDTIANSDAATSIVYNSMADWNYPYMMIRGEAGATAQKASYKLWWINRY